MVEDSFVVDSDYASFSVTAIMTIDGQQHTVGGDFEGTVRTLSAFSPTPRIVSVDFKTQNPAPLLETYRDWKVLKVYLINVGVTGAAAAESYKFAIEAPAGTGLQAKSSAGEMCTWGSTATTMTPWEASSQNFYLVRCGIGDNSSSLRIKIGAVDGTDTHDLKTDVVTTVIPQSWHQSDNAVKYAMGTLPQTPTPTPTPDIPPIVPIPTPVPIPDFAEEAQTAVAKWDDETDDVTFCREGTAGCTDTHRVTINVVTPRPVPTPLPDEIPTPTPTFPCNLTSLACVTWQGGYPEIGNQNMWFPQPLHTYRKSGSRYIYQELIWTDDILVYFNNTALYRYLPAVMLHEWSYSRHWAIVRIAVT